MSKLADSAEAQLHEQVHRLAQENYELQAKIKIAEERARIAEARIAEERARIAEERARIAEERARIAEERAGKSLLQDGLPRLQRAIGPGTSVTPSSNQHVHVKCKIMPFNTLDGISTQRKAGSSTLWHHVHKDHSCLYYRNEAGVQSFVSLLLLDVIREYSFGKLYIDKEYKFAHVRPDLVVILGEGDRLVGVVEVKLPSSNILEGTESAKFCDQILNYLLHLRSIGTAQCLGILTNYDQWVICWLPDCDGYAACKNVEQGFDFKNHKISRGLGKLHTSKVYQWCDTQLVPVLASTLTKMQLSQVVQGFQPNKLTSGRLVRYLSRNAFQWQHVELDRSVEVKLESVRIKKNAQLWLLSRLGGQTHGQVWLAADKNNNYSVCVAKILKK